MKDNFFYLHDQTVSFQVFNESVIRIKSLFGAHKTIVIKSQNPLNLYASVIAARDLQISLYVCPYNFDDTKVRDFATKCNAALYLGDVIVQAPYEEENNKIPTLGIFTSATTGDPKIALHRWDAIESSSRFVPKDLYDKTWLLSYALWGYAGLQVFFSALNSRGSIYFCTERFQDVCEDIVKYSVNIISATPTFWKMLIGAWPIGLQVPTLLQSTLGGEIVDQSIINLVDRFFHPSRLTHIYASTEVGTAIVVSDKLAGFPISFLEKQSKNGTRLRIIDDELQVISSVGIEKYVEGVLPKSGEWVKTGDLVQINQGRVYFLGRTDGRINIGGRKVCPEEVEQALNSLEEIEDCLVYKKKSPIVGNLIAADVVIKCSMEFNPIDIKNKLKMLLEDNKIPHIIRRVDHLAISSTGKKIRKFT